MNRSMFHVACLAKMTTLGKLYRRWRRERNLATSEQVDAIISAHYQTLSEKEKELLASDMKRMADQYSYSAEEYFLYDFMEKNEQQRLQFVPDSVRVDILEAINRPRNLSIFDDKSKTYDVYGHYYGRSLLFVGGESLNELRSFSRQNERFICKPLFGTCGQGIRILKDATDADLTKLVAEAKKSPFVVEQIIEQDKRLAVLHPESVNTIRAVTFLLPTGVIVSRAFIKTGRGESFVDNGGAGGIMCTIDIETGKVIAAADEMRRFYDVHPDTGERLVGRQIPEWDSLLSTVKELAMVLPSNRYAGWDLALRSDGKWVLVEANARGQFVGWQIPTQVGYWPDLRILLKELGEDDKF